LSDKRAQSVVAWLTGHGVAASRLTAKGFGQTKPVADNSTDDGRAKNRRVELVKQ
jgi:outer membrane protein OmpA-like peptidoglycan-associated protein